MTRAFSQGLRAGAYLLVSVGLLWLVWRWFDGANAWARLQAANGYWLTLALVLLSVQLITSAVRWRLTANQLAQPLTNRTAISQYYISMLCNLTLPGGMLGDAGRAWHHRTQAGLAASAGAVVLDRLAGQIAMVSTLAIGLAWQVRATFTTHTGWWLAAIAAALALTGALRFMPQPAWVARLINGIKQAWFAREVRLKQLGLTVLILGCSLSAFYACAQAVGADLTAGAALLVLPATLLVMVLPVSVAGWGLREAAAALIWPIVGVASDAAVAASVAYGIVATVSALPGLWWVRPRFKPAT
jgi:uncharacterized membrane protein YbhN (UPF0104 family)